jgi:hypothetical protein
MWWLIPPGLITIWVLAPACPAFSDNPYMTWADFAYSSAVMLGMWSLILYGRWTA